MTELQAVLTALNCPASPVGKQLEEAMTEGQGLYGFPRYYEIAFSFRDIPHEASVFDEVFKRYSKIPVGRVLELGSGTAPHLEEWKRRGVEYFGIDTSDIMLNYSKKKARDLGAAARFIKADMRKFSLGAPVDFAYVMLGSLFVKSTSDVRSHFSSVAKALNSGGVYFLDWCVNFQWGDQGRSSRWTVKNGLVRVRVRHRSEVLDRAGQMVKNTLTAEVDDDGKLLHLESSDVVRTIFPQELLLLIQESRKFEFVGWWNHWNLHEPIEKATSISRPIVLLRRK